MRRDGRVRLHGVNPAVLCSQVWISLKTRVYRVRLLLRRLDYVGHL